MPQTIMPEGPGLTRASRIGEVGEGRPFWLQSIMDINLWRWPIAVMVSITMLGITTCMSVDKYTNMRRAIAECEKPKAELPFMMPKRPKKNYPEPK